MEHGAINQIEEQSGREKDRETEVDKKLKPIANADIQMYRKSMEDKQEMAQGVDDQAALSEKDKEDTAVDDAQTPSYPCEYCPKAFKVRTNLRNHIVRVHGNGCYRCTQCDKYFRCEPYLLKHIADIHTACEYECDVCGKMLRPKSLQWHMANVHGDVRYKCELCGKIFKTKKYLRRHVNDIHSEQPADLQAEIHTCPHCPKTYKNKYALRRHQVCNHSTGSYRCHQCCKDFKSQINLARHYSGVHTSGEHECEVCKKVFRTKHLLKGHMRCVHRVMTPETSEQYTCKICLRLFKSKPYCRTHEEKGKCSRPTSGDTKPSSSAQTQTEVVVKQEPVFCEVELEPIAFEDCGYRPCKEEPLDD